MFQEAEQHPGCGSLRHWRGSHRVQSLPWPATQGHTQPCTGCGGTAPRPLRSGEQGDREQQVLSRHRGAQHVAETKQLFLSVPWRNAPMTFLTVPWQAVTGLHEQHTQRWQAAELPQSSALFSGLFSESTARCLESWRRAELHGSSEEIGLTWHCEPRLTEEKKTKPKSSLVSWNSSLKVTGYQAY